MKSISEKTKLLTLVVAAGKDKFGLKDGVNSRLTYDTPIVLQFNVARNEFFVCDDVHKIPCKFTEKALFWIKMLNANMAVKDLDGRYIFLNEYAFHSSPGEKSSLKLYLLIYSCSVLDRKEVKKHDYSFKKTEDVMENTKVVKLLNDLKMLHQREKLTKDMDVELPLEAILTNKKVKIEVPKPRSVSSFVKKVEGEEDKIISCKNMAKIEKVMEKDVKILLDQEKKLKGKVAAGSEGNLERDQCLSKVVDKMRNERLVEYLKDHGTVDRLRDPAKSPVKRGNIPTELLTIIEEVKAISKENISRKRKKAEGKRSTSRSKKKVAVEERGRKVAKTRSTSRPRKTSRSKSKTGVK